MSGFGEHLSFIAECVEPTDGLIRVPHETIAFNALRIRTMDPNELFYTSGDNVPYDRETLALTVDTNAFIMEFPRTEFDVLVNPALMRIWDEIDGEPVDGLLVDYRRIRFPKYRDAHLKYGTDTDAFRKLQEDRGTALPLAVVSAKDDRVIYQGPKQLKGRMEELMDAADRRLAAAWETMPKYNYAVPVTEKDIKRLPKPEPKKAEPEVAPEPSTAVVRYQGAPNLPVVRKNGMLDTLAEGAFYGIMNALIPKS